MTSRRRASVGQARGESPIELRFIDLFMVVVAALIFLVVSLSLLNYATAPNKPPRLDLVTRTIPNALQDNPYNMYLAASGGQPPYRWHIVEGALPAGLEFNEATGLIHGVTGFEGAKRFTVELKDRLDVHIRRQLELTVVGESRTEDIRLDMHSALLPVAVTYRPYRFGLRLFGGMPPYTYSITDGQLPNGIRLSPEGELTGSAEVTWNDPQLALGWRAVVQVRDSRGVGIEQGITIPVKYEPLPMSSAHHFSGVLGFFLALLLRLFQLMAILCLVALLVVALCSLVLGTFVVACGIIGFGGADTAGWRGLFGAESDWDK